MSIRNRIAKLENAQPTKAPWLVEILRLIDGKTRGLPSNERPDDGLTIERDGRETYWAANGKRIAWSALEGMTLAEANAAIAAALQ